MAKKKTVKAYTKQQFLAAARYTPLQKDMIRALLAEGEEYTVEQVDQKMKTFKQMEAK